MTKMKKNTSWFVGCNLMGRECVGAGNLDEKAVREVKKKLLRIITIFRIRLSVSYRNRL